MADNSTTRHYCSGTARPGTGPLHTSNPDPGDGDMHRDHKLGLALGVLVIGFAAALCFPRQPSGTTASLELSDSAELDASIELLPVRAYTDAEASTPAGTQAIPPDAGEPKLPEAALPGSRSSAAELELFAGPPEPLRAVAGRNGAPVQEATAWSARLPDGDVPTASSPAAAGSGSTPDSPGRTSQGLLYTVKSGDTLSGLAARFLGSTQRYLEIYEANRDVLESPNAIRAGLVLTIPDRDSVSSAEGARDTKVPVRLAETIEDPAPTKTQERARVDATVPADASTRTVDAPASRFRPAGRSPFLPGAARRNTEPSETAPAPASKTNGE